MLKYNKVDAYKAYVAHLAATHNISEIEVFIDFFHLSAASIHNIYDAMKNEASNAVLQVAIEPKYPDIVVTLAANTVYCEALKEELKQAIEVNNLLVSTPMGSA